MDLIDFPAEAFDVSSYLDGSIDFQLIQAWQNTAGVAIEVGMDTCVIKGNMPLGGSEDLSADCVDGFATATVVVYLDDNFEPEECDACNVDDLAAMGGNSTFCAYRIEIACEPMVVECGEPSSSPSGSYYPSSAPTDSPTNSALPSASPTGSPSSAPPTVSPTVSPTASPTASPTISPTASPTVSPTASPTDKTDSPSVDSCPVPDAILVANEGETLYPETEIPLKITFQNTTHVKFKIENTFDQTISAVYTQYHSGSFGETECLEESNVGVDTFVEADFTARCMRSTKISIVNVWIQDCSSTGTTFLNGVDNAEIPECCYPEKECKAVQYTFKLPCVDICIPEGAEVSGEGNEQRRRKAHEIIREKKALEGSTVEFEELTGRPEDNGSEDHFCVVEDYPCGPSHEKVHVCHYSARDGYKTFCVPESDSDALRFYPKDYCGPCVGGYATA